MIRPMLPRQRFQWRVPVGTHGADQAEQIVTLLRQIDVLRTPLARFIECLLMALRVRSDPYLDDRYWWHSGHWSALALNASAAKDSKRT
jgi:hypothetical protein